METSGIAGEVGNEVFWSHLAERVASWLLERHLPGRDAILLLPFAQHLALARRAWMHSGNRGHTNNQSNKPSSSRAVPRWQPRIETTHSLASALGPTPLAEALQISGDAAIDALSVKALLAGQSWAQDLRRADLRSYELAVTRIVEAAQGLLRASGQVAPTLRAAWWTLAREALSEPGSEGPGRIEAASLRIALEWAASDERLLATDALFALRPGALIVLQAGGSDPLALALLANAQRAGIPTLLLQADQDIDAVTHAPPLLEQALCRDFEEEAQCSAAAVLAHLNDGRSPVALIAQDRVLMRRVRALLERRGALVADDTGWTLATTPVAAQLMALLRAAGPNPKLDDWLAWLKGDIAAPLRKRAADAAGADEAGALALIEALARRRGWRTPQAVQLPEDFNESALSLWRMARSALRQFGEGPAERSLNEWIEALKQLLQRLGAFEQMAQLDAGKEVLDALWLGRQPWPGSAHEDRLQATHLSLLDWLAWVDQCLEGNQFVPPAPEGAQVFITPLARAMLRPFGAVVLPGADAQLGAVPPGPALLPDGYAQRVGLPTQEQRRAGQMFAFTQALRVPALTLLRRHSEGAATLAPSPLLERLIAALAAANAPSIVPWPDPRAGRQVMLTPRHRSAAQAAGQVPQRLSASAIDALRDCPYQFFARSLLKLNAVDELEAELEKSDYGTWLHAVLKQFHDERLVPAEAMPDAERLGRVAKELGERLPAQEFLPYAAGFEGFAQRYLQWLAEHEAAGGRYREGELKREITPWAGSGHALEAVVLHGRLDRVDETPKGVLLIDYKTGSVQGLRDKVKRPLEDTQLAVYAALMSAEDAELQAQYLALDDSKGIGTVAHPEVARSALALQEGLEQDLLDVHAGDLMPALGEGRVCEWCEMRGLCRRDDWQEAAL